MMGEIPRILIADDNNELRKLLELQVLEVCDADVIHAEDGQQAMQSFAENSPALSFVDINMPGIDGLTLLQAVRESDPEVPVIILSGDGSMTTIKSALDAGASAFLVKPYDKSRVAELVRQFV